VSCPYCKSTIMIESRMGEGEVLCQTCLNRYIPQKGKPDCGQCHGEGRVLIMTSRLGVEVFHTCGCVTGTHYDPAAV
jgi:hypothetical protein